MGAERDAQRDGWPAGPHARSPGGGPGGQDGRTSARAAVRPPKGRRPLLSLPQLARESGLSVSVLYRWFGLGELAGAVRLGGRIYVRRRVWEGWLAGEGEAPVPGLRAEGDTTGGTADTAVSEDAPDERRRIRLWPT